MNYPARTAFAAVMSITYSGCSVCPCVESGPADAKFAADNSWIARTIKSPTYSLADSAAPGYQLSDCPKVIEQSSSLRPTLNEIVSDQVNGNVEHAPLLSTDGKWRLPLPNKITAAERRPLTIQEISKLGFICTPTYCSYSNRTYSKSIGYRSNPLDGKKIFNVIHVCIRIGQKPYTVTATNNSYVMSSGRATWL